MSDFDQRFRDSLGSAVTPSVDPYSTLSSMSGRLGVAKKRRQAFRGAGGGLVMAVLIVGGVMFAQPDQTSRVSTVTGPADSGAISSTTGLAPTTSTVTTAPDGQEPVSADGRSAPDSTTPVDASGNDQGGPTSTSSAGPTVTTNGAPSTTVEPSENGSTSTSTPATTTSTPTAPTTVTSTSTTTAPGSSQTRASICGSVTVAPNGSGVSLVAAVANSGFSTDIEDSGPETVEVGFESSQQSCEIKARLIGGAIVFEVELDDDDDDDDDGDDDDESG